MDHFGRFSPCLNTIPFCQWTLHSYLFRLSTLLSIVYSIHSWCHLSGNMGDASLPHPRVHNLVTRHSKKRTLSPHFASVCRCAVSLSSFSLLSLRVLVVSMSERADTHPAPSLNADPPLSFRTHSRHAEAFQGLGASD